MTEKPTFIDALAVKAGRSSGVYLQGEVRGEVVYMPLTVEGARSIAGSLLAAAKAVEEAPPADAPLH